MLHTSTFASNESLGWVTDVVCGLLNGTASSYVNQGDNIGSAALSNGVVTVEGGYVTGELADILGLSNSSQTITTCSGADSGMLSYEAPCEVTGSTKLVNDLGLSSSANMIFNYGGTNYTVSASGQTVASVLTYMSTATNGGINAYMSGNQIVVESDESVIFSGTVAGALGLTDGTYTSETKTCSATSDTHTIERNYSVTGTTKLIDMGLSEGTSLNGTYDGTAFSSSFSVDSDKTVNDLLSYLSYATGGGISGTASDGSISLTSDKSVTLNGAVATRLGLTDSWSSTTFTTGQTTSSDLTYSTTQDVELDTYLVGDMGIASGSKLSGSYNGVAFTDYVIDGNTTVNDILSYLNTTVAGNDGTVVSLNNHKIVINSEEQMILNGAVATGLGINCTTGASSTTVVSQTTQPLSYSESGLVVGGTTKLVDMGLTAGQKLSGTYGGNAFADYTITDTTTVEDLVKYGLKNI